METKVTTPVVKGVIISLILIVISLALQFLNLNLDIIQNKALSFLQFVIIFGGIIWSCISYAKQMKAKANVTYGNVFSHGFKIAAAVTAIMVIFTIISIKFINPQMKDIALEQARTQLKARDGIHMSDDEMDKALTITKNYFLPLTAGATLFFFLFAGLISALIGAAVARINPPDPFVQKTNL